MGVTVWQARQDKEEQGGEEEREGERETKTKKDKTKHERAKKKKRKRLWRSGGTANLPKLRLGTWEPGRFTLETLENYKVIPSPLVSFGGRSKSDGLLGTPEHDTGVKKHESGNPSPHWFRMNPSTPGLGPRAPRWTLRKTPSARGVAANRSRGLWLCQKSRWPKLRTQIKFLFFVFWYMGHTTHLNQWNPSSFNQTNLNLDTMVRNLLRDLVSSIWLTGSPKHGQFALERFCALFLGRYGTTTMKARKKRLPAAFPRAVHGALFVGAEPEMPSGCPLD